MAEARKQDWIRRLAGSRHSSPKAFFKPIASGDILVASRESDQFKFLRNTFDDALAVDMESYGFLEALKAFPKVHPLVIRGISDLCDGGEKKIEEAAASAAAFCFEVLAQLELASTRKEP